MRVIQSSSKSSFWFWAGLSSIWLLSLGLRIWGLERFNTLVFDEVYFARYGNNYLAQQPFFDAHPPLGKYMIALGIWLHGTFEPVGYRWMNALVGSLIPLLVVGIAYQLSQRRSFALLAGLLTASDGLLLVESRYSLINIHLLFWGLLGQLLFLLALQFQGWKRWLWLLLTGCCLGATVAVKWNGLGFALGLYLIWIVSGLIYWLLPSCRSLLSVPSSLALPKLQKLSPLHFLLTLPLSAAAVYLLSWVPHWLQNPGMGFWELQQQMFDYHRRVGGNAIHAYCSPWYSWPLMLRPVSYFFQRAASLAEPVPTLGPPLPWEATEVVYDVHAMGNPILWWLSTPAILFLVGVLLWYLWRWWTRPGRGTEIDLMPVLMRPEVFWIPLFLVVNYAANLLPWVSVGRCLFIYHYMAASLYSFIALVWVLDAWLAGIRRWQRGLAVTGIFLILAGFVFWMPIFLGLPISQAEFSQRIWRVLPFLDWV